MRRHSWFYLLLITAFLLPGCQTTDETAADVQAPQQAKVIPLTVSISSQHGDVSDFETNECLNCHADKARLIETAKVEEAVEAESSGVG